MAKQTNPGSKRGKSNPAIKSNRFFTAASLWLFIPAIELLKIFILKLIKDSINFNLQVYLPYILIFCAQLAATLLKSYPLKSFKKLSSPKVQTFSKILYTIICIVLYLWTSFSLEDIENAQSHQLGFFSQGVALAWIILIQESLFSEWYLKIIAPTVFFMTQIVLSREFDNPSTYMLIVSLVPQYFYLVIIIRSRKPKPVEPPKPAKKTERDPYLAIDIFTDMIFLVDEDNKIFRYNKCADDFLKKNDLTLPEKLFEMLTLYKKKNRSTDEDELKLLNKCSSGETETPIRKNSAYESLLTYDRNTSPLGFREQLENARADLLGQESLIQYEGGLSFSGSRKQYSFEIKISLVQFIQDVSTLMIEFRDVSPRDFNNARKSSMKKVTENFMSIISHEFNTPLNTIINQLDLALKDVLIPDKPKIDFIEPVFKCAKLLEYKVLDTLDFTRLAHKDFQFNYENVDLFELMTECKGLIETQAKMKNITFKIDYDEMVPKSFKSDPKRLGQILMNLLTNAIKNTFKGTVTLKAAFENSLIRISVVDTGIGLQDDAIQRLRLALDDPLNQEKITNNSTGISLGLRVSNLIAQALGPAEGRGLNFESFPNEYTEFYFYLELKKQKKQSFSYNDNIFAFNLAEPERRYRKFSNADSLEVKKKPSGLSPLNEESADTISVDISNSPNFFPEEYLYEHMLEPRTMTEKKSSFESSPAKSIRKDSNILNLDVEDSVVSTPTKILCRCKELLIVDDEPFNVATLQKIITDLGFRADEAYNGQQAIEKLTNWISPPCCGAKGFYKAVLMDYSMPIMNGLDATKKIRELIQNQEIPNLHIIGITAHPDIQDECISCGMDVVLKKPLAPALLKLELEHRGVKCRGKNLSVRKYRSTDSPSSPGSP